VYAAADTFLMSLFKLWSKQFPSVPLEIAYSLIGSPFSDMPYSEKRIISIGDTATAKLNIVRFYSFGSLLKLQTSLIDLNGITA